ncbi:unnamed protein product [Wuchereria bancrofti]|uniref:Uncharacterized protein n=1 Tax=Wuchereria bancrofti TaxID=6293 RepID=A0A3P7DKN4_WUCBA|nr:unnamed protein product [Wuchereria bancrofti]
MVNNTQKPFRQMIPYVAAFLDVVHKNGISNVTQRFFFTGSTEAHRSQDNKSIAQWCDHISSMISSDSLKSNLTHPKIVKLYSHNRVYWSIRRIVVIIIANSHEEVEKAHQFCIPWKRHGFNLASQVAADGVIIEECDIPPGIIPKVPFPVFCMKHNRLPVPVSRHFRSNYSKNLKAYSPTAHQYSLFPKQPWSCYTDFLNLVLQWLC